MNHWTTAKVRPPTRGILARIEQHPHDEKIRYIILFGSEARGEARLGSDIDIALVSDEPLTRRERLAYTVLVGDSSPEVRFINTPAANLDTKQFSDVSYHIKRDGVLIYER